MQLAVKLLRPLASFSDLTRAGSDYVSCVMPYCLIENNPFHKTLSVISGQNELKSHLKLLAKMYLWSCGTFDDHRK